MADLIDRAAALTSNASLWLQFGPMGEVESVSDEPLDGHSQWISADAIAALPAQGVHDTATWNDAVQKAAGIAHSGVEAYGAKMRAATDKKEKRDWQSMLMAAGDIEHAILAALEPASGGVEAEPKRLRAAVQDMVTVARQDGWAEATTGRQIVLRAVEDALVAQRVTPAPVAADPVEALVKALHPDQLLEIAERLIRMEASRDHEQKVIDALRYIADALAAYRGGAK